jgi:hypothetical protein
MPSLGFKPTTSAVKQPQTYALDRGHWDWRWQLYFYEKVEELNTRFSFVLLFLTSFYLLIVGVEVCSST